MEPAIENLEVYKISEELAVRVHCMSLKLPTFETYEEASQVRRSSKRIVANIIEGHAQRKYKALHLSYLYRALGSSEETQGHLRLLRRTRSLADDREYQSLWKDYSDLSRRLFSFIRTIERSSARPRFTQDFLDASEDAPVEE
jgi:four helix bundle protein